MLGDAYFSDGRFTAAELAYRKTLEVAPSGFGARTALAAVLLESGQPSAAIAAFDQLEDEDDREWGKALANFALGRKADSDATLAVFETRFAGTDAYAIAQVQAYRGEINEAFKWLDRAYRQHDPGLDFAKTDWFITKLRGDLRYKAFLRKMNLPE
jgi:adenylate cyclase